MIVALWFTIVGFVLLVGFGLTALTFRHWYLEKRKKAQNEGSNLETTTHGGRP